MSTSGRLADRVRRAASGPEKLLVLYVTLGDPVTGDPPDLLLTAVRAGADVIELGLATPGAAPRGQEMRESFARAREGAPSGVADIWRRCAAVRALVPEVALVPLVFRETIADVGIDALIEGAAGAGMDGLLLVDPDGPEQLARIEAGGLAAIPVIRPSLGPAAAAALEQEASLLTYRTLADTTGATLDLDDARRALADIGRTARKPFIVGFGLREAAEIRALAAGAAGFVIGSELIRRMRAVHADQRAAAMAQAVAGWKAATFTAVLSSGEGGDV